VRWAGIFVDEIVGVETKKEIKGKCASHFWVWVMELCQGLYKQLPRKIDPQLTSRQTGMPVGLGLLHATTSTHRVYVCVSVWVCVCVAVVLAKNLLDSRKLNIVPAKLLNAFSLRASHCYPLLTALDVFFLSFVSLPLLFLRFIFQNYAHSMWQVCGFHFLYDFQIVCYVYDM